MAPASEPDDLARQFDLIRQALTLLHPGARLRRVTIEFVGGADPFVAPMRGSVPGCDDVPPPARPLFEQPAPKARPAEEIEELTPMQLEILNVIDHMTDGETLSADAIANRAGYGPIASGPARDFISQVAPLNGLKRGPRGWVRPTQ